MSDRPRSAPRAAIRSMIGWLAWKTVLPSYCGQAVVDASGVIDVRGLVESVARAGVEVVGAVGRGGVDGASSLVGRDVVGENAEDGAIQKRMLKRDPLHARAFEGRDGNGGFQIAGFANRGGQRLGDDVDLTLLLERYVVEIRMKRDGE